MEAGVAYVVLGYKLTRPPCGGVVKKLKPKGLYETINCIISQISVFCKLFVATYRLCNIKAGSVRLATTSNSFVVISSVELLPLRQVHNLLNLLAYELITCCLSRKIGVYSVA